MKKKEKQLKFVEHEVLSPDADSKEIHRAFNLGLGTDLDKLYKVVTGQYRCPKLPGEPARITAPSRPHALPDSMIDRFEDYDFKRETPMYGLFNRVNTKKPYAQKLPEKTTATSPAKANGKVVVNPTSWNITVSGDQIIFERPAVA
jgi:hypothetical protein